MKSVKRGEKGEKDEKVQDGSIPRCHHLFVVPPLVHACTLGRIMRTKMAVDAFTRFDHPNLFHPILNLLLYFR